MLSFNKLRVASRNFLSFTLLLFIIIYYVESAINFSGESMFFFLISKQFSNYNVAMYQGSKGSTRLTRKEIKFPGRKM